MSRQATDRDRATLAAIEAHIAEHGFPPSQRELGERLGLSSPSTIGTRLLRLVELGWVERGDGARAIRVRERNQT